jgi:septum formation protein maf
MVTPLTNLEKYKVVLASGSPRRRELLAMLGVEFTQTSVDADESYPEDLAPECVPAYLSRLKIKQYLMSNYQPGELVITADTVVIAENEVLGKPRSEQEARDMLHRLSGHVHRVVTGVCVSDGVSVDQENACTEVEFAELTDAEINYYIERYKPMDKAGAYGIQEWIGCIGVKRIDGSFYNVMGLPLHKLYTILKKF